MAVERLRVVPVNARERRKAMESQTAAGSFPLTQTAETGQAAPPPTAAPQSPETTDTSLLLSQTLAIIAAISGLTASRLLLLLAVCGAFYLATIAAGSQANSALFVLIAYAVLIVLPLVWLDSGKRPH